MGIRENGRRIHDKKVTLNHNARRTRSWFHALALRIRAVCARRVFFAPSWTRTVGLPRCVLFASKLEWWADLGNSRRAEAWADKSHF